MLRPWRLRGRRCQADRTAARWPLSDGPLDSVVNPSNDPNDDGGSSELRLPGDGGYTDPLGDAEPADVSFDSADFSRLLSGGAVPDNTIGGEDGDGDLSGGPQTSGGDDAPERGPYSGGSSPTTGDGGSGGGGTPREGMVGVDSFSALEMGDLAFDFDSSGIGEGLGADSVDVDSSDWAGNVGGADG